MTAANGDELYLAVDGGFIPATEASGSYDVTGGSGRFDGASGRADFALSSPDGASFRVSFRGWLER